jgi:hypothetical protein
MTVGGESRTLVGPDGSATVVHDFGGDGPVLLFVHATGMHGWVWTRSRRQPKDSETQIDSDDLCATSSRLLLDCQGLFPGQQLAQFAEIPVRAPRA